MASYRKGIKGVELDALQNLKTGRGHGFSKAEEEQKLSEIGPGATATDRMNIRAESRAAERTGQAADLQQVIAGKARRGEQVKKVTKTLGDVAKVAGNVVAGVATGGMAPAAMGAIKGAGALMGGAKAAGGAAQAAGGAAQAAQAAGGAAQAAQAAQAAKTAQAIGKGANIVSQAGQQMATATQPGGVSQNVSAKQNAELLRRLQGA